ncbi:hypothetical protein FQA39_LY17319 [Lamprigera yunnana]|nr:hypothetical protein FQA39_LY17319 [Lamprigera yunnana]
MAFVGVQFEDDGTIALISTSWLTPRKTETFWPPHKTQEKYVIALMKHEIPEDRWTLFQIKRSFLECGSGSCSDTADDRKQATPTNVSDCNELQGNIICENPVTATKNDSLENPESNSSLSDDPAE